VAPATLFCLPSRVRFRPSIAIALALALLVVIPQGSAVTFAFALLASIPSGARYPLLPVLPSVGTISRHEIAPDATPGPSRQTSAMHPKAVKPLTPLKILQPTQNEEDKSSKIVACSYLQPAIL
jgi:hypothetical protein